MKKVISIALAAVMALSLVACGGNGLSGKVATDGSTSMQKVIMSLKENFEGENSGVEVTYNPTGSGAGIAAVAEGRCDIGLSSRNLKNSEKEQGLVGTVLAYDGIAVIVNPENTVEGLTVEQIAAILNIGRTTAYQLVKEEQFRIVRIGNAIRVSKKSFDEWLESLEL